MISVNEYFEGQVKSLGFESDNGKVSTGVMAAGEYTFGTAEPEVMKVVHGELIVKLPGEENFVSYPAGSQFSVPGNSSFDLKVPTATAYVCYYG